MTGVQTCALPICVKETLLHWFAACTSIGVYTLAFAYLKARYWFITEFFTLLSFVSYSLGQHLLYCRIANWIRLSIYLSIYPSIYYLSIYLLSIHLPIYQSIHLSIYPSIYPSIYLSIYLSICLSIYLLTWQSASLPMWFSITYIISITPDDKHFQTV